MIKSTCSHTTLAFILFLRSFSLAVLLISFLPSAAVVPAAQPPFSRTLCWVSIDLRLGFGIAEGEGGGLEAEEGVLRAGMEDGVLLRDDDLDGVNEDLEGDFWMLKGFGYGVVGINVLALCAVDELVLEQSIVEEDVSPVAGQGGESPRGAGCGMWLGWWAGGGGKYELEGAECRRECERERPVGL